MENPGLRRRRPGERGKLPSDNRIVISVVRVRRNDRSYA